MKKLIILTALICTMLASTVTSASISKELTWSESTVWRCAVRFIRVDNGFQILEKDKETGYLLFEFKDAGRTTNGSLEILRVVKNDREYVRIQMNLHGQPKYVESLLFNKLERKLKNEYGVAPTAKSVAPPSESESGPADANAPDSNAGDVDADATEEELRITEDDLNQNNDE
ncbi:MAG: hypothetical protein JXX14_11045 [Deltaproteobacteria bacterium]|nr:hypothetical protein [Deltaproteobacteria bacterium]